jgi:type II secretory pathway predicted ATPase ExeA
MDEAQFGMQERPFDSGIAQDVDVFLGRRQEAVIGRFKIAVASPDAVVTFSGPAGVGKTTLALAAVRATSTRLAMAWLNAVPANAQELLELLLVELGMNAHRTTRVERLQMWRQYLSELIATESRVFVVAERTEDLSPEVLRALDSLTAADANGCPGANIVLLGQAGLDQFLAAPGLDSLRQRIRLRQRLEPFSVAELTDYLRHRVTRAGGALDEVFAPGAAAAVQRYSGGIARIANSLCETALGVAAADRRPRITAELIAEVAVDMLGIAEPAGQTTAAAQPTAEAKEPKAAPIELAAPPPAAAPVAVPTRAVSPPPARAPVATPTQAVSPPPAPAPVATPTQADSAPAEAVAPPRAATPPPAAVVAPPAAPSAPPMSMTPPVPVPARASVAERSTRAVPPLAKRSEPKTPPPSAPAFVAFEPPKPTGSDFDATATDVPDVSSIDFPVLTDAVEAPAPPPAPARAAPPPTPAASAMRPAAARTPSPAPRPAATARPAASAAPSKPATPPPPPAAPRAAEPKRPAPSPAMAPPTDADEDADLLRQTQTMRALSVAKSIDDVSDSMAETLFGDADLDALSAALASAGFDPDDDEGAAPEPNEPPPAESDDIMDLFNLGPDAPLELIDDSSTPRPGRPRKSATRR